MRKTLAGLFIGLLMLSVSGIALASPITGDPVGNSFGWVAPSTNALNYAQQVPGRIGQVAPYVLFDSSDASSVTLDFYNLASGGAFFEYRIDGVATGSSAHPVVTGDTIHSGKWLDVSGTTTLLDQVFSATQYVDVRLALGGERDWDFDWTRFSVAEAAPVPEPSTFLLLGSGLAGLCFYARKRNKA